MSDEPQNRRNEAAKHFFYADPKTGDNQGFDKEGNYTCGTCRWLKGSNCGLIENLKVDPKAGSCGDWEKQGNKPNLEMFRHKSSNVSVYGVAKNGEGFGCHRCSFASKMSPDSEGRDMFCSQFQTRVFWNACCILNDVDTK